MAIGSVLVAIQASFDDGRGVSPEDFIAPLNITDQDGVGQTAATAEEWQAGLVEFGLVTFLTMRNRRSLSFGN